VRGWPVAWRTGGRSRRRPGWIELTAESELVLRMLGEHAFNHYIEIKRQEEMGGLVRRGHQWDLDMYLATRPRQGIRG
jgi:hypothetical protein